MRAISLSRPWPWAILELGKGLDNRSRRDGRRPAICGYRGPLLLHAAWSWDTKALPWMVARRLCNGAENSPLPVCPPRDEHLAGGIFARCNAVGHIGPDGRQSKELVARGMVGADSGGIDLRWWMGGYALVFVDLHPTPFVFCRGHQGLWRPSHDVLDQLGERVTCPS